MKLNFTKPFDLLFNFIHRRFTPIVCSFYKQVEEEELEDDNVQTKAKQEEDEDVEEEDEEEEELEEEVEEQVGRPQSLQRQHQR